MEQEDRRPAMGAIARLRDGFVYGVLCALMSTMPAQSETLTDAELVRTLVLGRTLRLNNSNYFAGPFFDYAKIAARKSAPGTIASTALIYEAYNSLSDLNTALGLSVEAKLGLGFISSGTQSKYSQIASERTLSSYVLIKLDVEKYFEDLPANYEDLITNQGKEDLKRYEEKRGFTEEDFQKKYGDCYVEQIVKGASYCAVLRVNHASTAEKNNFLANLGASGVLASASGDIAKDRVATLDQSNYQLTVLQRGIPIGEMAGREPSEISAQADRFLKRLSQNGNDVDLVPVKAITSPWSNILPTVAKFSKTLIYDQHLKELADEIEVYQARRNDLKQARENEELYEKNSVDKVAIAAKVKEYDKAILQILELAEKLSVSDSSDLSIPVVDSLPEDKQPKLLTGQILTINSRSVANQDPIPIVVSDIVVAPGDEFVVIPFSGDKWTIAQNHTSGATLVPSTGAEGLSAAQQSQIPNDIGKSFLVPSAPPSCLVFGVCDTEAERTLKVKDGSTARFLGYFRAELGGKRRNTSAKGGKLCFTINSVVATNTGANEYYSNSGDIRIRVIKLGRK